MTTATERMTRKQVEIETAGMRLSVCDIAALLDSHDDSPVVASKGACALCVLRRRRGRGWRYLGYAVWSCSRQSWVRGSWSRPLSADDAHRALVDMPWDG